MSIPVDPLMPGAKVGWGDGTARALLFYDGVHDAYLTRIDWLTDGYQDGRDFPGLPDWPHIRRAVPKDVAARIPALDWGRFA